MGCIAAIYQDRAASHEAGIIRSKPDKRFGDFCGRSETFQGTAVSQFRERLLVGGTHHRRIHIPRAQCHDTDMVSPKIHFLSWWNYFSLKEGQLAQKGNHEDDPCADQGGYHSRYGKGLTCHPDTDEQQDQDREKEEVQEVVQIFYGECQERDHHDDQL